MADDPRRMLARLAASLPAEDAALAAAFAADLQAAQTRRLTVGSHPAADARQLEPERLLSPQETAKRLGVSIRWLYRNAGKLPFTRKLTKRTLRFHEQGLAKYIRDRRA